MNEPPIEEDLADLHSDIDSMVAALNTETPPAPEIENIVKNQLNNEMPNSYKDTLKAREALLYGLDDLIISRGQD